MKLKTLLIVSLLFVSINLFATTHYVVENSKEVSNKTFKNFNEDADAGGVFVVESTGFLTIDETLFLSNYSGNAGGAIMNYGESIIHLTTFNSNEGGSGGAICNSRGKVIITSTTFYSNITSDKSNIGNTRRGGAIANTSGDLTISSTVFSSNKVYSFSTSSNPHESVAAYGGAICIENFDYNGKKTEISLSTFTDNEAISFGGNYSDYSNGSGGAIYNIGGEDLTISSTVFTHNKAQGSGASSSSSKVSGAGGAFYNVSSGKITISSASFISNEAIGIGGNLSGGNGGAIYNSASSFYKSEITFIDDINFIDNKASSQGGAIYNNKGTINLVANINNVEFTGNTANGISNAIHDNKGTINLWASENSDILFNDRITSEDSSSILNINSSTNTLTAIGKIILNEDMSGFTGKLNLYNGEIELKSKTEKNSNVNTNKIFSGNINLSSGTLNILNNAIDNITMTNLTTTSNANLKFDTDLSNNTSDNFTVTNNATGQLNLTAINILGVNETSGKITLFNNKKSPILNILTNANYGGYEYTFSTSDTVGVLIYEQTGTTKTFKEVVNTTEPIIRSYSLANNEIITENLGSVGGCQLSIFGNGYDIISQDSLEGIYIGEDKVLNIENINNWCGFNTTYGAIKNEGTLNISETNFSDNEGQDIINNGTLFLDGICYFENGIIGQGTTTIKGIVTSSGTINNSLNINSNGKLINNGRLTVNNGINNGTIEQTKNISNMTIIGKFINNNTINQDNISIEDNAILETSATNINGTVTNNGILNFTGGTNNNEINGTGLLTISNNFINNNNINQKSIYLTNATLQQTINSILECENLTISNSTIDLINSILQENKFKNLTINDNLNLSVDADLENKQMDTISANGFSGNGKINVKAINLLSDAKENKTEILFTSSTILKDKITTTIDTASSKLFKYDVNYDKNTGNFNFLLTAKTNPIIVESQVARATGLITQNTVLNQAFSSIDNIRNRIIQAKQKGLLYASTADVIFESPNRIESGLWIRPFMSQDTISFDSFDVDNNLTGTLAGIDLVAGENNLLSFYLGYAGSNQKYEDIQVNQTGYIVGATGMIIKERWYAGITANVNFNKAESQSKYGTDSFDLNMYSVGAKAGYNFDLSDKFILEPNLTLMYGNVGNQEYETIQGAKIDSQSTANIIAEPQVKAKLNLTNGWQPYGLLGYLINAGEKVKLVADNIAFDDMEINGYVEYGVGVNKTFKNSPWSCYLQLTGKSGDISGFDGNIGIKYSFLNKEEKEDIELIKYLKEKEKKKLKEQQEKQKAFEEEQKRIEKEEKERLEREEKARIEEEKERQKALEEERIKAEKEEQEKQRMLEIERKLQEYYD